MGGVLEVYLLVVTVLLRPINEMRFVLRLNQSYT